MTPEEARALCWEAGDLEEVVGLHHVQRQMRARFYSTTERVFVMCCARRLGKSYLLTSLALEACRRYRNNQVFYVASTQKQVRSYLLPMVREQIKTCPEHLRPKFRSIDGSFIFPETGMRLTIVGADNGRLEDWRGNKAILVIVDEAALIDDLGYNIRSILGPFTKGPKGKWNGKIVLASTPPKSAAHDFRVYCERAAAKNAYCHFTIYDNPLFTEQQIQEAKDECFGEHTTDFQREYEAKMVTDEKSAVIPEFTKEVRKRTVVPFDLPKHFRSCTAVDLGYSDLTFCLLLVYDFRRGKVLVVDERVLRQPNSEKLVAAIRDMEGKYPLPPTHTRYVDASKFTVSDLQTIYGLTCGTLRKDDKDAALNNVRLHVHTGKLEIHERCTDLPNHLEYAIWNKTRTSFDRSESFGHYDGVDALKYGLRHLDTHTNPYPLLPDDYTKDNFYAPKHLTQTSDFGSLFSVKSKRRR